MKRIVFLISCALFAVNAALAGDSLRIMESMTLHSRILGQDVRFSVCLPENYYKTTQSYPVVYLLHGLGDDETSWLEYGRISQYADQAVGDHEAVPMIFVMPQGYRTYYVNDYQGTFRYQDMFVTELVPYIDKIFRTIPKKEQRAVMGYSMGGFGAFMIPVKHPDLFGISVPLSMSVRDDNQYMTEEAKGWDEQWGRLFGAPGLKDSARLTPYYKQNSPFHFLDDPDLASIKSLRIYMDNGDKEQTLCRANEELHLLLDKKKIPHEFRVREGGHSFDYWCSALPNALRFISDGFEGKPYRGDLFPPFKVVPVPQEQLRKIGLGKDHAIVFVPAGYDQTSRLYPVLYFTGIEGNKAIQDIAARIDREINKNEITPLIVAFLPGKDTMTLKRQIATVEEQIRVRKGYRLRAIAGFKEGAPVALSMALNPETFGTCILSDGSLTKDQVEGMITGNSREILKRTLIFIDAPCHGAFAEGNGNLHMQMRDRDIQHEYRVREGNGGVDWAVKGLDEIIQFTVKRFHK